MTTGMRLSVALFGFTLLSWLVSYYSSKEHRTRNKNAETAPPVLAASLIPGTTRGSADSHDHSVHGIGHDAGEGDDLSE